MTRFLLLFAVFAVHLINLYGWLSFNQDILNVPVGVPVKFYTSLYFIILCLSLLLKEFNKEKLDFIICTICDMIGFYAIILIGGALFLSGVQGAIKLSGNDPRFYDLPSIATLCNFLLLSYSIKFKIKNRVTHPTFHNTIVLTASIIALFGYATNTPALYFAYPNQNIIGMALITAVSFLILSLVSITDKKLSH